MDKGGGRALHRRLACGVDGCVCLVCALLIYQARKGGKKE